MDQTTTASDLWLAAEPVHAVTYFTPEAGGALAAAGYRGFWMSYFAGRAAPLGPVGPAVVVAAFGGFAPAKVARALPDAWSFAPPASALEARLAGADEALARLLPPGDLAEVVLLAEAAADAAVDVLARPLCAANRALPRPTGDRQRLWQALTTLREHRGDGHLVALAHAGLGGLDSLVLMAGTDRADAEDLRTTRGWTVDEWAAATASLADRGLVGGDGRLTPAGDALHDLVEAATDRLAAAPLAALGPRRSARLVALLLPLAKACAPALRFPNPMALPPPT